MTVEWHKVEVFSVEFDLSPLLFRLRRDGIDCRVTEEASGQWLWVGSSDIAVSLKHWLENQGGEFEKMQSHAKAQGLAPEQMVSAGESFLLRKCSEFLALVRHFPVTLGTIFLAVLGAALVEFDSQFHWIGLFTFQPVRVVGNQLGLAGFQSGWDQLQYWRAFTPVFLHFGIFHILFNGLWIWEFGRRIELRFGSGFLALTILAVGVASNSAQYLWQGPSLFGGLSGVLYALLGFLWIHNRLRPHRLTTLPPGIIGFMLFWMVLCMSGAVNVFLEGSVANAAHFGGLISGMALALLTAKLRSNKQ